MKILVTGGAGFIGSHVVDAYLAAGHDVAVIDNLEHGTKRNVPRDAQFFKADIRDTEAVEKIFAKVRPTILNHHAARISVTESVHTPGPTLEVNLNGTTNLLSAFAKYGEGKKKVIFASTGGAIYGEPKTLPATEDTPANPLTMYGLSKLMAEGMIQFYAREHGISYVILRYPNVYGPRQTAHGEAGVVPIFAGLMKAGKRPTIFGDGSKKRDYVYVGDVVSANVAALKSKTDLIANLGWGTMVSDQQMFDAIAGRLGFTKKPVYTKERAGEVYAISLSAMRARKALGWIPKVPFKEGISQAVG